MKETNLLSVGQWGNRTLGQILVEKLKLKNSALTRYDLGFNRALEALQKIDIDVDKIFEIIRNSHFIDTKGDCYHSRKEKEDWLEKDCFKSLAQAIKENIGGCIK